MPEPTRSRFVICGVVFEPAFTAPPSPICTARLTPSTRSCGAAGNQDGDPPLGICIKHVLLVDADQRAAQGRGNRRQKPQAVTKNAHVHVAFLYSFLCRGAANTLSMA